MVRNPMNAHQISRIKITPDVVDCIVFWTKDPGPMISRLDELDGYSYYFQFTLNGYGRDVEPNVPDKFERMVPTFKTLSQKIGKEKVIWRYDPILFSSKYDLKYHMDTFSKLASELCPYTEKCVISFVDIYDKNSSRMNALGITTGTKEERTILAKHIASVCKSYGVTVASCAESIDLDECGITHNSCIDKNLIERIIGYELKVAKDKVQRAECGCVASMEIGSYDSCPHQCLYCYANRSFAKVKEVFSSYDPASPLLCSGEVGPLDKVTDRPVKSIKGDKIGTGSQINLFDILD